MRSAVSKIFVHSGDVRRAVPIFQARLNKCKKGRAGKIKAASKMARGRAQKAAAVLGTLCAISGRS